MYKEEEFYCCEKMEDELHMLKALIGSLNAPQTRSLLTDFEGIGSMSLHVNPWMPNNTEFAVGHSEKK